MNDGEMLISVLGSVWVMGLGNRPIFRASLNNRSCFLLTCVLSSRILLTLRLLDIHIVRAWE